MKNLKDYDRLIKAIAIYNCERSFREFFNIFYPELFETSVYYVKNNLIAEEIVSELFVKLWLKRNSLTEIKNIEAYLFISIKRLSLNYLRQKKTPQLYLNDIDTELCVNLRNPEDQMLSEEELLKIKNAIENLPEKCRLVFLLVKENGLKYKEVASTLDISEKMVEKHISTALKKLRKELSDSSFVKKYSPNIVKVISALSFIFFS
ncbi:RNA polymerase sigma factor [Cyclobacterium amurskyense]|uniref:RNA polymerase ECF-type sigma factor n=1 Tax=Cyclobacterium amurskyense TaxID=320787 RepID=A0A0H4PFJ2_9BACT|nr:RNA polymerase sigma-70 factor [Cyclobacterium amurskyense]AKP51598.1 RNA polymerase ECF-type sigma factor [Cyclobacterium amurskyense]